MVDALRRAHRIVTPDGFVVDLHPGESPAAIEVGDRLAGYVNAADGRRRHAAANAAIATAVTAGWFAIGETVEFSFHTYGDTVEALRDYIEEHWRDAAVDAPTVTAARQAVADVPGVRPRARERVLLTVLRPLATVAG